MELPTGILTAGVAGLVGFYVAMLGYCFGLSKDADIDFQQGTLPSQKTRELDKMREFVEAEVANQGRLERQRTGDGAYNRAREQQREKIKKVIENNWSNAYECYKIDDRLQRMMAREEAGRIVSIVGIVLVFGSVILRVAVAKNLFPYQGWVILTTMWFLPCVVVAILAIDNVRVLRSIRLTKRKIEKTWQF